MRWDQLHCWVRGARRIARIATVGSVFLVSYAGIESSLALVELGGGALEVIPVFPPQVWVSLKLREPYWGWEAD